MKKIVFFCAIIFSVFILNVNAAECELVMDADSGRVLYEKNAHEKRLIASTTKILTSLVVLNNSRLKEVVTVGDEVLKAYGSAIYIKPGEKLTVEDLLYGLMLRSGNDAAIALAVHVAGSVESFAKLMNETAASIGMFDSIFYNPHGLDEETQNKSTVYDMALLMREAMKNEDFKTITKTTKYVLKTNFNTYEWYNKNKLLTNYKYATGGKIGYTTTARHTFVSSATKDGKNLIVATFVDSDRFGTHENLYEKYFSMYKKYNLIDKDNLNINYKRGVRVFTTESFDMLLSSDELGDINREVTLYNDVKVGQNAKVIGNIAITKNGVVFKKLNIYGVDYSYNKKSFWQSIKEKFGW